MGDALQHVLSDGDGRRIARVLGMGVTRDRVEGTVTITPDYYTNSLLGRYMVRTTLNIRT